MVCNRKKLFPSAENPDFIFLSQAMANFVFELVELTAQKLGPIVVHTGTEFKEQGHPNLKIWKAPKYDNSSYASRFVTWMRYLVKATRDLWAVRGKPVLLIATNPPLLPVLGYVFNRLRGWPYVVRVLDVYPDVLERKGMISKKGIVFRIWARFNRLAFKYAATVVTLAAVMGENVSKYTEGRPVEIIPDWADTDHIKPKPKTKNFFAKKYCQINKLTVLYSGNLGTTHDLSGLFRAVESLEDEPNINFFFIGGGGRQHEFKAMADRFDSCTWLPLLPEEIVPFSMASADVGIITIGRGMEGISMPSKCYYMMAAGCAILGISSGENDLTRLITKYDCGVSVGCSEIEGVKDALLRFHKDREFLDSCKRNSRKAAEEVFSKRVCTKRYLEILGDLQRGCRV